jgi:solute carrier family 5 (sodium-coupled monocarboxylate transporter), member 8/12
MLGTPSEIYNYGSQYWLVIVAVVVMSCIVCTVYLPVFCSLKLGSSYEVSEVNSKRVAGINMIISICSIWS